jgi:hypothetical protein
MYVNGSPNVCPSVTLETNNRCIQFNVMTLYHRIIYPTRLDQLSTWTDDTHLSPQVSNSRDIKFA